MAPFGHRPSRLSRRRLIVAGAAALGGLALSEQWIGPRRASAGTSPEAGPAPQPLPGGVRGLHFYPPGRGIAISTIGDFDGIVGVADLIGTGTGQLADGTTEPFTFRVDNRFMAGQYVDSSGQLRTGAFVEL